jgi:hypothetical protein
VREQHIKALIPKHRDVRWRNGFDFFKIRSITNDHQTPIGHLGKRSDDQINFFIRHEARSRQVVICFLIPHSKSI